jgi:predicted amidohydrolase
MRVTLLQPEIIRGDIGHNLKAIQSLIDKSKGDLLVLPEYAFTGSLVLDLNADIHDWASQSAQAETRLSLPDGKYLVMNALLEVDGSLYNCCKLLPTGELYCKLFPDETELKAGIRPGSEQKVFELLGQRFKIVICYDLTHMSEIPTDALDFILFIYHFTGSNYRRVLGEIREVSAARRLPVLVSSLVSDRNNGFSSYIDGDVVVSLSDQEGLLEIEIDQRKH